MKKLFLVINLMLLSITLNAQKFETLSLNEIFDETVKAGYDFKLKKTENGLHILFVFHEKEEVSYLFDDENMLDSYMIIPHNQEVLDSYLKSISENYIYVAKNVWCTEFSDSNKYRVCAVYEEVKDGESYIILNKIKK